MNALAPLVAHDRLERVLAHTLYVLKEIRRTDRAGALSGDLARIWCRHLGPTERCMLLCTAAQAADQEDLDELGFCLDPWPWVSEDPFQQRSKQRAADAFLELNAADRREFLAMVRGMS